MQKITEDKTDIFSLSRTELAQVLSEFGEKPFRLKQVWQWLYVQGVISFDEMTNLSKDLRIKLSERFAITRPKIVTEQISADKTHKWLLEFADGQRIETVFIPEANRGAVCISTQVGCAVGCRFCHTGSQKITRNLTAGEIVGQFMLVKDVYHEWNNSEEGRLVSNVVVMGMGEPLHNVDNVIKALNILTDCDGLAVSKRRITLSTSGIVPNIPRIAKETGVKLAISLHAPNNEKRSQIMPINNRYKIEEILTACQEYQKIVTSRYITFEYLMLDGFNDNPEDAAELIALMKKYKIGAKFNLIPFNPWPGCTFQPSSNNRVLAFSRQLEQAGFAAPVRTARGQDILAACGQLKSKTQIMAD